VGQTGKDREEKGQDRTGRTGRKGKGSEGTGYETMTFSLSLSLYDTATILVNLQCTFVWAIPGEGDPSSDANSDPDLNPEVNPEFNPPDADSDSDSEAESDSDSDSASASAANKDSDPRQAVGGRYASSSKDAVNRRGHGRVRAKVHSRRDIPDSEADMDTDEEKDMDVDIVDSGPQFLPRHVPLPRQSRRQIQMQKQRQTQMQLQTQLQTQTRRKSQTQAQAQMQPRRQRQRGVQRETHREKKRKRKGGQMKSLPHHPITFAALLSTETASGFLLSLDQACFERSKSAARFLPLSLLTSDPSCLGPCPCPEVSGVGTAGSVQIRTQKTQIQTRGRTQTQTQSRTQTQTQTQTQIRNGTQIEIANYTCSRYFIFAGLESSRLSIPTLSEREILTQLDLIRKRGWRDWIHVDMTVELELTL